MYIPQRYLPVTLSKRDKVKPRKLYQKDKYFTRPKVASFKTKPSAHVKTAKKIYGISTIKPSRKLAIKTGCSKQNSYFHCR